MRQCCVRAKHQGHRQWRNYITWAVFCIPSTQYSYHYHVSYFQPC